MRLCRLCSAASCSPRCCTISIVPGGLGAFEAMSVLSLRAVGVELPVALAATLLFRGLSFWLPMLPGALLARSLLKPDSGAQP